MAIQKLPTNFVDDIIDATVTDKRKYRLENNSDGTISLEDVTTYVRLGTYYGMDKANSTNATVNQLIDATSNIQNTADSEKRVAYAENAGNAEHAINADNSINAENAINAITANSTANDFILVNSSLLDFSGNTCVISDERITENSLADVYFTSDTIIYAEDVGISVETYDGRVVIKSIIAPTEAIKASIKIRVV